MADSGHSPLSQRGAGGDCPHSAQHPPPPRLVAWETTRKCNLSCVHCRAAADKGPYPGELSTDQGLALLAQIRKTGQPIVILTGGEPMLRDDIYDLARHGTDLGLKMVMAPNGTLVTRETAARMAESGIRRISVSLDGAEAASHDAFRGVPGAFDQAVAGIRAARDAGLEFQVNTTITQKNLAMIPAIQELAVSLGAAAHHIFLLVPTGRGKYIVDQAIGADQYEETLNWFYDQRDRVPLVLKATCAPHYYRILRQRARAEGRPVTYETHGLDAMTRGCLGGSGFCFVSYTGIVKPCGFLDLPCGDVTKTPFDEIWQTSEVFGNLRDADRLKGKCGTCEYRRVCGGCRARAFEATGDYLAEEPLCSYRPLSP